MDKETIRQQIKNTLDTPGWDRIEEMIKKSSEDLKDVTKIKGNLRNDVYAREARARAEASKKLDNILNYIYLLASKGSTKDEKDYE